MIKMEVRGKGDGLHDKYYSEGDASWSIISTMRL